MKSKYIAVLSAITVLVFVLSVGLAWAAGESRMHRNIPGSMQGMSLEEMREFCEEMHDDMGSMMGGSGKGGGMMGGSGDGGGMGGSGMMGGR